MQGPSGPIAGQEQLIERAAKGSADKDIQVGLYLNVLSDCSSGPLPTIRLVNPPSP